MRALPLALLLVLGGCGHNAGEEETEEAVVWNPIDMRSSPRSRPLFDESRVVDFHVTFPPGQWDKLVTSTAPADQRWVDCGFAFEGETFADAACRRKGNMGDWERARKPQFVVRFNLKDKMARFRGLRRLNLEAFDDVEAPVRDRLGMWVMREAGLDASRVNHVRVWKDGELLGVYMNVEAVDKEMIEDHFQPHDGGNLWEEGELKTNEDVNDRSRYERLQKLIADEPLEGDHAAFFTALDALIDVPQVLRLMAAETVLLTGDNFSNGSPRNFFYYDHPERGFMVLPWDLDLIYLAPIDADPFAFWSNQRPNKLRQLMNQNPAWRDEFVNHLVDIRDNVLARAPARLAAICRQAEEAVRADRNRRFPIEGFLTDCATLREKIKQRADAIRRLVGR